MCVQKLEIGNMLVNASSNRSNHTPPIAPPPRQAKEQNQRVMRARFKGVLKDRNMNTPRAPPDTTCAACNSWKDIKTERYQSPICWKQDMKDRHREKKRDRKVRRLLNFCLRTTLKMIFITHKELTDSSHYRKEPQCRLSVD